MGYTSLHLLYWTLNTLHRIASLLAPGELPAIFWSNSFSNILFCPCTFIYLVFSWIISKIWLICTVWCLGDCFILKASSLLFPTFCVFSHFNSSFHYPIAFSSSFFILPWCCISGMHSNVSWCQVKIPIMFYLAELWSKFSLIYLLSIFPRIKTCLVIMMTLHDRYIYSPRSFCPLPN